MSAFRMALSLLQGTSNNKKVDGLHSSNSSGIWAGINNYRRLEMSFAYYTRIVTTGLVVGAAMEWVFLRTGYCTSFCIAFCG